MAEKPGLTQRAVRRIAQARRETRHDWLAVEEPLELRIAGEPFATTMRTPGADRELALGLLFAEGVIAGVDDVGGIAHCGRPGEDGYGNVIEITAAAGTVLDAERVDAARRPTVTTSACGVCGRRSIDDLVARARPVVGARRFTPTALTGLAESLLSHQSNFAHSGGVHAAGLTGPDAELSLVREDVGRHNAVDKVVGALLLQKALPATDRVLVVSGRASFEIVQKACVAGVSVVVSVSAPTSLAVDTAERLGLTLAGFARGSRINVYSGGGRIDGE